MKDIRCRIPNGMEFGAGELNIKAKLTEEKVLRIRKLRKYDPRRFTLARLARKFNVSRVMIHYIDRRKSWKHVKEAA